MASKEFALSIAIGAALSPSVGNAFNTVSQKAGRVGQALKQATLGKALAGDVIKYKETLETLKAKQQVLGRSSERLERGIAEVQRRYKEAKRDAKAYGIVIGDVVREQKRFARQAQRAERILARSKIRERNKELRSELTGEAAGTAGAAYALWRAIKPAINFESAMADVRKVVDFPQPDGLVQLGKTLKQTGRWIPVVHTGLAEIAAAGGQLGVGAADLPGFTVSVAKMATAFEMLPAEAGDAMAKLANIYQIPIGEMEKLGDAINHLADNTAAKARDIVPVLARAGGSARQFGLSAVEVTALADAFIALGKRPEVAGTAINAMLIKMQTASRQGSKFQDALEELGYSAEELEAAIAEDAQGALSAFLETLAGVDQAQRAGLLSDLFGLEYADDISLLAGSLDQYRKALALVADESQFAGSMTREFEIRSRTTANQLILLGNGVNEVGINIGTVLLPAVNGLVGVLQAGSALLADFAAMYPGLTQVVVGAAVAVIAFKAAAVGGKLAGTLFSDAWVSAKAVVDFFRISTLKTNAALAVQKARIIGAAGAQRAAAVATGLLTAAQWALNVAMSANPIGLIIAGVAALAGAAYLVWKQWAPVKAFFGVLWQGIKTAFKTGFDFIKKLFKYSPIGLLVKAAGAVGSLTGGGSPAAGGPRAAFLPPPAAAAAGNVSIAAPIQINAAPGMDARQVAEEVERKLREREERARAGRRGALYD